MQTLLRLCALLMFTSLLAGCQTSHKPASPACQKLRRQQAYNRRNNSVEASWNTKAQQARLNQLLKENNC